MHKPNPTRDYVVTTPRAGLCTSHSTPFFCSQGFCLPRRGRELPMAEEECTGAGHQAPTLAAAPPSPIPRETWEGCSVLLDINDGDRLVFARLSPAASVSLTPALLFPLSLRVSTTSYSISLLWLLTLQDSEDREQEVFSRSVDGLPIRCFISGRERPGWTISGALLSIHFCSFQYAFLALPFSFVACLSCVLLHHMIKLVRRGSEDIVLLVGF
ncbi:hypothetical protein B296_00051951 [Ensete ventricosum]|uniref:Uncharacterized protein n=1 Tax=Ensete ventricosum TaxID=4639 RepID=A0A426XA89_ENSVE|nr:hypothetical protein B296_00051951 [Ensete ventricosum]